MNEASRPRSPKVKQVLPLVQQDSKWQYLLTTWISRQEQGSKLYWVDIIWLSAIPWKKWSPSQTIYTPNISQTISHIYPQNTPVNYPLPPSGPHFVGLKWSRWGIPIYKMKSYNPSYNPGCLQNVSLQGTQLSEGISPKFPKSIPYISRIYIYIRYIYIYIYYISHLYIYIYYISLK